MSLFKRVNNIFRLIKYFSLKGIGFKKMLIESKLGFKLFIEFTDVSAPLFYFGNYEVEETNTICNNVKPYMIVMDIGANIGFFTLLMARLVGPEGTVHSFEPNPDIQRRLKENIKINPDLSDDRIKLYEMALGARNGKTTFYCPIIGHEGVGGIKNTERAPLEKTITVKVNTLDDFIIKNNIKKIDFIKMDIEGGELDVLKGADYTLNKIRPIILFEGNEVNTEPYGYRVFEIILYLEKRGYAVKKSGSENFIALPGDNGENIL